MMIRKIQCRGPPGPHNCALHITSQMLSSTSVMDRGIPTEAVLAEMRAADPPVRYLVGTPKGRLSRLEQELLEKPWQEARPGVQVKLLPQERRTLRVRREPRSRRQGAGDAAAAAQMAVEAAGATRGYETLARGAADEARLRAQSGSHRLAFGDDHGRQGQRHVQLSARPRQAAPGAPARRPVSVAHQSDGDDPAQLWRYYLQLVAVEQAFKCLKGDLAIRPIFHQQEARIEAHIFVAFLAYALHVTLGRRLHALAPGLTPRSVLEKFAAVQMIDVHVPTTDGRELVLTRYTEPEPELRLLLAKLRLDLPTQPPPKIIAKTARPQPPP